MPTEDDKREHERKTFFNEIVLEFSSGRHEARISDLSLGGCYVDTIASVPEGEAIALVMSSPAGESMRFEGEVAYVLPGFGFGVRFTGIDDEATKFLDQIIQSDNE